MESRSSVRLPTPGGGGGRAGLSGDQRHQPAARHPQGGKARLGGGAGSCGAPGFERASAGELHPAMPPLLKMTRIGLGHSMGAMLTVTQQAAHATYERVALIGYSVRGVALHR